MNSMNTTTPASSPECAWAVNGSTAVGVAVLVAMFAFAAAPTRADKLPDAA